MVCGRSRRAQMTRGGQGGMGRVDVRDRRDQRTPGRINWPSPRTHSPTVTGAEGPSVRGPVRVAYSRRPLIDCTIPMPHARLLGRHEETRQEIVRLLMWRRVGLKARASTRRNRAVIRTICETSVTNCDRFRNSICDTSARASASPPRIDGSTPKPHALYNSSPEMTSFNCLTLPSPLSGAIGNVKASHTRRGSTRRTQPIDSHVSLAAMTRYNSKSSGERSWSTGISSLILRHETARVHCVI